MTACSVPRAHLEGAAELDLDHFLRAGDLPGVGLAQPVVRLFVLPAVADGLLEDAVFVPQAVTHRRQLHRRHRVEEAGRQPAEAAIAEAGVRFLLEQCRAVDVLSCDSALAPSGSSRRFMMLLPASGRSGTPSKGSRRASDSSAVVRLLGCAASVVTGRPEPSGPRPHSAPAAGLPGIDDIVEQSDAARRARRSSR